MGSRCSLKIWLLHVSITKNNFIKTDFVGISVVFFSLNFFVNFLEPKISSAWTSTSSQPLRTTPGNTPGRTSRNQSSGTPGSSGEMAQMVVSVETFSGLRLRSVTKTLFLLIGPKIMCVCSRSHNTNSS